jgi:hypothetical protein
LAKRRGERNTRSGGTPRGDSDEMSPLYEIRCLTAGLLQMRLRPITMNVDGEERCRRAQWA